MTHDPGKEDLAEKQLSHLYQTLDAPEAGSETDDAILAFARQRTMTASEFPNKPVINWKGGFSVAASIVLVSVLYWAQLTPENYSQADSSDLITPPKTTEQDVIIQQRQRTSALDVQEQKVMVTAARVAPLEKAMSVDSLSVNASETISQLVASSPDAEASTMIAEEESEENQIVGEQFQKEQFETIQVTGRRSAADLEEQIDEQTVVHTDAEILSDTEVLSEKEVSIETEGTISDIEISAAERFSLTNQLANEFVDSSNPSSSVLPDCNLSLHGGYKLASTSLAKYTVPWNDNDKIWLINMLNDELNFAKVLKSSSEKLSDESRTLLNKPGFSDNYAVVVNQIRECRKSFGRAIQ